MHLEKDAKKAAAICLETIKLDPENYRLGHTKVFKKFFSRKIWKIFFFSFGKIWIESRKFIKGILSIQFLDSILLLYIVVGDIFFLTFQKFLWLVHLNQNRPRFLQNGTFFRTRQNKNMCKKSMFFLFNFKSNPENENFL